MKTSSQLARTPTLRHSTSISSCAPSNDPNDPLVSARQVCDHFFAGISDMTLWRWLRDPELGFPRPLVINRRRYWREDEIKVWLASRPRDGPEETNLPRSDPDGTCARARRRARERTSSKKKRLFRRASCEHKSPDFWELPSSKKRNARYS